MTFSVKTIPDMLVEAYGNNLLPFCPCISVTNKSDY
ncbi:hypothetical protein [Escherichia coli]|nr:hypothetical protein [Escherichia coli]